MDNIERTRIFPTETETPNPFVTPICCGTIITMFEPIINFGDVVAYYPIFQGLPDQTKCLYCDTIITTEKNCPNCGAPRRERSNGNM